jgi:hypothetical protein
MDGLKAYSTQTSDGGVTVDIERMAQDLIMVLKGMGHDKDRILKDLAKMWDDMTVNIEIPNNAKN